MTHEDRNQVKLQKDDWVYFGEERDEGKVIHLLSDDFVKVLQKIVVLKQGEGRVWTHLWVLPASLTTKGEQTNKAKKALARAAEIEEKMEHRREMFQ